MPQFKITNKYFTFCRENPGVISKDKCWVFIHDCWLYCDESILGLIHSVIFEWKHDKHLVGY